MGKLKIWALGIIGVLLLSPGLLIAKGQYLKNPGVLPDSFLYVIDRALEEIWSKVLFQKERKIKFELGRLRERGAEIQALIQKDRVDLNSLNSAFQSLYHTLDKTLSLLESQENKDSTQAKKLDREWRIVRYTLLGELQKKRITTLKRNEEERGRLLQEFFKAKEENNREKELSVVLQREELKNEIELLTLLTNQKEGELQTFSQLVGNRLLSILGPQETALQNQFLNTETTLDNISKELERKLNEGLNLLQAREIALQNDLEIAMNSQNKERVQQIKERAKEIQKEKEEFLTQFAVVFNSLEEARQRLIDLAQKDSVRPEEVGNILSDVSPLLREQVERLLQIEEKIHQGFYQDRISEIESGKSIIAQQMEQIRQDCQKAPNPETCQMEGLAPLQLQWDTLEQEKQALENSLLQFQESFAAEKERVLKLLEVSPLP